jgi:hypothetical protein
MGCKECSMGFNKFISWKTGNTFQRIDVLEKYSLKKESDFDDILE